MKPTYVDRLDNEKVIGRCQTWPCRPSWLLILAWRPRWNSSESGAFHDLSGALGCFGKGAEGDLQSSAGLASRMLRIDYCQQLCFQLPCWALGGAVTLLSRSLATYKSLTVKKLTLWVLWHERALCMTSILICFQTEVAMVLQFSGSS